MRQRGGAFREFLLRAPVIHPLKRTDHLSSTEHHHFIRDKLNNHDKNVRKNVEYHAVVKNCAPNPRNQ